MLDYRIYTLDQNGRVVRAAVDVQCRDDAHAMETAAEHSPEHGKEVWQFARFVGRAEARGRSSDG